MNTCALLVTGKLMCWGANSYGQLGDTDVTAGIVTTPVEYDPTSNDKIVDVSGDEHHICVLLETGKVKCAGSNSRGQKGIGYFMNDSYSKQQDPMFFLLDENGVATEVKVGHYITCVRLTTGRIKCAGGNNHKEFGVSGEKMTPILLNLYNVAQMSLGLNFLCAALDTCEVACYGNNFGTKTYSDSDICVNPTPFATYAGEEMTSAPSISARPTISSFPSLTPSAVASSGPSISSEPSLSGQPTISISPSIFLENDFSIRMKNPIAAFGGTTSSIMIQYMFHTNPTKTTHLKVWNNGNCNGRTNATWVPQNKDSIQINNGEIVSIEPGRNGQNVTTLNVTLGIDTSLITEESDLWFENADSTQAKIKLCLRLDAYSTLLNESISFMETELSVVMNMTAGIENAEVINLSYVDPSEVDEDAALNISLDAWLCKMNGNSVMKKSNAEPMQQNSICQVCIFPSKFDKDGFSVDGIKTFTFKQGDTSYSVVEGFAPVVKELTKMEKVSSDSFGAGMMISTPLISRFFQDLSNNGKPHDVTILGTAKMDFRSESRRLETRMRSKNVANDNEWEEGLHEPSGTFAFDFAIASPPRDHKDETKAIDDQSMFSKMSNVLLITAVLGCALLIGGFAAITRKKKQHKQILK